MIIVGPELLLCYPSFLVLLFSLFFPGLICVWRLLLRHWT
jgi:hypothetical protein